MKKLLQTKEFVKELMIDAFKDAIPEVRELQTFPMIVRDIQLPEDKFSDDEENFGKVDSYHWLWLLPNGKAIIFSKSYGLCYLNRHPSKFEVLYDTRIKIWFDGYNNTSKVTSYIYQRPTQDENSYAESEGVAVEFLFTDSLVAVPPYFEALEANELVNISKQKQLLDSWKKTKHNLIGFEVSVFLNGFILESDYEYYKNLVQGIDRKQLALERGGRRVSNPVDFRIGENYASNPNKYLDIVHNLEERLESSNVNHLIAYLGQYRETCFPCFKNMEDLLSRRDKLFGCIKSDKEVKDFVAAHNKALIMAEKGTRVTAKAIVSGYSKENQPQVKLI